MYFWYGLGSSFAISSAMVPYSIMFMSLLMSACKKVPGILTTSTDLRLLNQSRIIMTSNDSIRELVSALVVHSLCYIPFMHSQALMVPMQFLLETFTV